MRLLTVAILTALLSAGAAAQDKIYKVRLPDGRILFTDRPPAGAKILSEREVPPPPADAPARPGQGDAGSASLQKQGCAGGDGEPPSGEPRTGGGGTAESIPATRLGGADARHPLPRAILQPGLDL